MSERRRSPRVPMDLYVNKYVKGYPYACRLVDLSEAGLRIERLAEPQASDESSFPIEIGKPGCEDTVWVWAKSVWRKGRNEALSILHVDPFERLLLLDLLEEAAG